MIDKYLILSKLTPFENNRKTIVEQQTIGDIVDGILQNHNEYTHDYDAIYQYFLADNLEDTCYNIWQFLKDNCPYKIEPDEYQTLRSPAAILSKKVDCKGYATFINGTLDAIRRNENLDFNLYYCFAGYNNNGIEHVFAVCETQDKKNIWWIDPVCFSFDDRSNIPTYTRNKKISPMALQKLSGINNVQHGAVPNWRMTGKREEISTVYNSLGKLSKMMARADGSIYTPIYDDPDQQDQPQQPTTPIFDEPGTNGTPATPENKLVPISLGLLILYYICK